MTSSVEHDGVVKRMAADLETANADREGVGAVGAALSESQTRARQHRVGEVGFLL
jgi:hypothetical protein